MFRQCGEGQALALRVKVKVFYCASVARDRFPFLALRVKVKVFYCVSVARDRPSPYVLR